MKKALEARLADYRQVLDSVVPRSAPAAAAPLRHRQRVTLMVAASLLFLAGIVGTGILLVNRYRTIPASPVTAPAPGVTDSVPTVDPSLAPTPTTIEASPTTTVLQTTDAATALDVFAIGDSVMTAATSDLSAAGIWVDAQESRQSTAAAEILERAADQNLLGDAVVIHIGTNGPLNQEQVDRLMRAVSAVPTVVILTVKADVAWIDDNNTRIRALPATYPNVTVVDWEAAATANPQILYADHVHLKGSEGAKFYANLILKALGRDPIS